MTKPVFELTFSVADEHIDELGHVNNAAWVQWIQSVAVAHWDASADEAHKHQFYWVIVRHEIDYLRAGRKGARITARTWVAQVPRGARFDRWVEFVDQDGATCVRAKTQWAIIERSTGRPVRVPPEVVAPFVTAE